MQEIKGKLKEAFEEEGKLSQTYRVVCEHAIKRLKSADDETVKRIKEQKLNIAGAVGKMKDEASKVKNGNCAVLTYDEGIKIVDNYFGFNEEKDEQKPKSIFDLI